MVTSASEVYEGIKRVITGEKPEGTEPENKDKAHSEPTEGVEGRLQNKSQQKSTAGP